LPVARTRGLPSRQVVETCASNRALTDGANWGATQPAKTGCATHPLTFDLSESHNTSKVEVTMSSPRFPIPQSTLDMLLLQFLSFRPAHGHGIAHRIEEVSRAAIQVNQGSLYPALHRLEQKGWLKSEWRPSESGREAKFYALTNAGSKQLATEKASWDKL